MSADSRSSSGVRLSPIRPGLQQIDLLREAHGEVRVLLGNHDGEAEPLVQVLQHGGDLQADAGSEPEGGLVHHQELGARHQRPAERSHLALATRLSRGLLVLPFLQARKEVEHGPQIRLDRVPLAVGADEQVLLYPHEREEVATLRRVADAEPDDPRRRHAADVAAFEFNFPAAAGESDDRVEEGRLAGTVGADHGGRSGRLPPRARRRAAPGRGRRRRRGCRC